MIFPDLQSSKAWLSIHETSLKSTTAPSSLTNELKRKTSFPAEFPSPLRIFLASFLCVFLKYFYIFNMRDFWRREIQKIRRKKIASLDSPVKDDIPSRVMREHTIYPYI